MYDSKCIRPPAVPQRSADEVNAKRPPLPQENPATSDGYYTAIIGTPTPESGTIEKGERAGRPWLAFTIPLMIEVPAQVQESLGIKLEKGTIQLTDRAFIDLTEQNTIDNSPGRNRRQRQYRDALDLNKPGDTFSWSMVAGKPVKLKIQHEMYQGEIQERVGQLLKA